MFLFPLTLSNIFCICVVVFPKTLCIPHSYVSVPNICFLFCIFIIIYYYLLIFFLLFPFSSPGTFLCFVMYFSSLAFLAFYVSILLGFTFFLFLFCFCLICLMCLFYSSQTYVLFYLYVLVLFCRTQFAYFLILPVLDLYVPSPASALLVGL